MHLRYDLFGAYEAGETRHAQHVMHALGISYQHATPQSICDQWWFWNCQGAPAELPPYLTPLDVDPMKCIGWGLSAEDAASIADARHQEATNGR